MTVTGKYTRQLPEAEVVTGSSLLVVSTFDTDEAYKVTVDTLSFNTDHLGDVVIGNNVDVESLVCPLVITGSRTTIEDLYVLGEFRKIISIRPYTQAAVKFEDDAWAIQLEVNNIASTYPLEITNIIETEILQVQETYEVTQAGNINIPQNSFVRATFEASQQTFLPYYTRKQLYFPEVIRDQHNDYQGAESEFQAPALGVYHCQLLIKFESAAWSTTTGSAPWVAITINNYDGSTVYARQYCVITFDELDRPNTTFDMQCVLFNPSTTHGIYHHAYSVNEHVTYAVDGQITYTKID